METAKIVGVQTEGLIPSPNREGEDVSVDHGDGAAHRVSPGRRDRHSSAPKAESQKGRRAPRDKRNVLSKILRIPRPKTEVETERSGTKHSSAKRRRKTLRFSVEPKISDQEEVENSNSRRLSASPKPHSCQEGGRSPEKRLGQRVRRSSSTEGAVASVTSFKRTSLSRSTSEQGYSTQVLKDTRVSPRNSSRRWRDDAFHRIEHREEGELDSIFRFIAECTRSVVHVLKEIPTIISELPKRTRETLERFLLLLQRPNVPLLKGSSDSSEAQ